jgi:hypothetical protein
MKANHFTVRARGPCTPSTGIFLSCCFPVLAIGALLVSGTAFAQSGRYFVTDESGFNRVWQFQGGTLVSSFPTVPAGGADGPIIVDGNTNEVRSVKGGFSGGSLPVLGSEYDFAGVVQGPVSLDFSAHGGYGRVIDAAFDGQNTYIVSGLFANSGVFRYNFDFSGTGTLMFNINTAPQNTAQGITYDTLTNTIWTSDYDFNATVTGGRVRQWSLTGTELFSFPVVDNSGNASERNTALAYDFSDDTFWMNAHVENTLGFGFGELWQFDRNGNFLQKIHALQTTSGAPSNILYWGGEIFTVPEPASLALFVSSIVLVSMRRHRRAGTDKGHPRLCPPRRNAS